MGHVIPGGTGYNTHRNIDMATITEEEAVKEEKKERKEKKKGL